MWSLVIFQILFVVSSYNIREQEIHAGPIISYVVNIPVT